MIQLADVVIRCVVVCGPTRFGIAAAAAWKVQSAMATCGSEVFGKLTKSELGSYGTSVSTWLLFVNNQYSG
jgi:hypothetical protein